MCEAPILPSPLINQSAQKVNSPKSALLLDPLVDELDDLSPLP
jgi:hypothetical protein